jgi:hypothetical protein
MLFSCNLDVPRTDDENGIPADWVHDPTTGFELRGCLFYLLTCLPPDTVVTAVELDAERHEDDSPIAHLVPALLDAGYLRAIHPEDAEEHYELVHPDRFPPLTAAQ